MRCRLPTAALCLAVLVPAGCRMGVDDPDYNPYAPPGGDRPALQTADDWVESAERGVAELDRRMENALY